MALHRVDVALPDKPYRITIGSNARSEIRGIAESVVPGRQRFVVTDQTVAMLHGASLRAALGELCGWFAVPPGEPSKSLRTAECLFDQLAAARFERGDLLIAFGGGVVGDLTGFAASVWMRGVRFLQAPTTLESAIDASVGGKTGLNLPAGKNLIGSFHQPAAVIIDTDFLQTLTARDLAAGLAESVKHAAIGSEAFFAWHEQILDSLWTNEQNLTELIVRNCETKAGVVLRDEREQNVRATLNYGHTIGHAVESLLGYELRHGECVALGIRVENQLAVLRGHLAGEVADRISRLLDRCGLPARLPRRLDPVAVLQATRSDKKVRRGVARYALLNGIGHPVIAEDVRDEDVLLAFSAIQPG